MNILIKRRGQIIGSFSEDEAIRKFDAGELDENDLAMVEGATGWHELASYIVQEPVESSSPKTTVRPPSLPFSQRDTDIQSVTNASRGGLIQRTEHVETTPVPAAEPTPAPEPEVAREAAPVEARRGWSSLQIALACIGAGLVVMALSAWPWMVYIPLFVTGLVATVIAISRGRVLPGAALLLAGLLLPALIWSLWPGLAPIRLPSFPLAWPAKSAAGTGTAGGADNATAAAHSDTAAEQEAAKARLAAEEAQQMADKKENAENPPPADTAATAAGAREGQRVVLKSDATLLFRNQPFRQAGAGEEFEVLASRPNTGRVYVKGLDATGKMIALSLPTEVLAPVGAPPTSTATPAPSPVPPAPPAEQSNDAGAVKSGLSMDVKPTTAGRAGLAVQIQNLGKSPRKLRLESYFIGTPPMSPRTPYLLDSKTEVETVEAGKGISMQALPEVGQSSAKVGGWIVRLMVGDEAVQVRASNPSLEQVAKDPDAFDRLIHTPAPPQAR